MALLKLSIVAVPLACGMYVLGYKNLSAALVPVACGLHLLKQYMNGGKCKSSEKLDGQVVIVTGSNTGIRKETAKDLVKRGAKVYVACRSLERARSAVSDIINETGVDADQLPIMSLDLASLQSVRDFVAEFKKKEKRLDILINNAGVMWVPKSKTVDGFEQTFGVNHLGHFLLTNLLIDLLLAGNLPSRVVTVSSIGHCHGTGTINFDDLMFEKKYSRIATYSQSKLANILFTRELARRLKGTSVTTYALHPGAVLTELGRYIPVIGDSAILSYLLLTLAWPFFKEPWNGAQTTINCAVDKELATESGKYYSDCKEAKPLVAAATDDDIARRLWDVSVELVQLKKDEIHPQLR